MLTANTWSASRRKKIWLSVLARLNWLMDQCRGVLTATIGSASRRRRKRKRRRKLCFSKWQRRKSELISLMIGHVDCDQQVRNTPEMVVFKEDKTGIMIWIDALSWPNAKLKVCIALKNMRAGSRRREDRGHWARLTPEQKLKTLTLSSSSLMTTARAWELWPPGPPHAGKKNGNFVINSNGDRNAPTD